MIRSTRLIALVCAAAGLMSAMAGPGQAQSADAVRSNAAALFNSPHQVTLGNRSGEVTLVEFFDYNCGFCRNAMSDLLEIMRGNPKLRVVLKEYPVLGPASIEAARVAVAVRMQDAGGSAYIAFHQKLAARGRADRDRALSVAREVGLDVGRLRRDLGTPEIETALDEGRRLAAALGITGTPSYVVGDQVILGAVGLAGLREAVVRASGSTPAPRGFPGGSGGAPAAPAAPGKSLKDLFKS